MNEKLKNYFSKLDFGDISEIVEIKDGLSDNHLNYKVITNKGVYVAKVTKPGDLLSYSNLSDEYTVLKLVEKYSIGPKVLHIDLEGFDTPILIEEFINGVIYTNLQPATEEMFTSVIDLLFNTSNIPLDFDKFPFKFTYTTFQTNFRVWDIRMGDIIKVIGEYRQIIGAFKNIIDSAKNVLEQKDSLFRNTPREFVYNDVHPGNLFWLPQENKAKFIDWQKVSLGSSIFMAGLFARRFGHLWGMNQEEFSQKVLTVYKEKKNIDNIEELFRASILERAVSDMIWIVWAEVKRGGDIKEYILESNKGYAEAKRLLSKAD